MVDYSRLALIPELWGYQYSVEWRVVELVEKRRLKKDEKINHVTGRKDLKEQKKQEEEDTMWKGEWHNDGETRARSGERQLAELSSGGENCDCQASAPKFNQVWACQNQNQSEAKTDNPAPADTHQSDEKKQSRS